MAELSFKKKSDQALTTVDGLHRNAKPMPDYRGVSQRKTAGSFAADNLEKSRGHNADLTDNRTSGVVQNKRTGLPVALKSGIESLSGMSMDHVKVHYNSSKPARLNAHAYAQGSDIHVAPGQDKHLPHEAWHVVQQAQGRVKPTMQMKTGIAVNDNKGLEHEADVMGARAAQSGNEPPQTITQPKSTSNSGIVQKVKTEHDLGDLHYGIHAARYDGYDAMPDAGGLARAPRSPVNPITVDELNLMSGLTPIFDRADRDYMRGYFAVINFLTLYVNGAVPGKPGRWLEFLRDHIDYLRIDKHVAQIQAPAAGVTPTKDRLNKNGMLPNVAVGETNDGKRNAIVAAHGNGGRDAAHAAYDDHVASWVWDVFFRRTSKLGIDFTVAENKVIHMNTYAPAWGVHPAGVVTNDAANPQRERQPITHSEMRHINRNYGTNHAAIDMYHMPAAGAIGRPVGTGSMLPYADARAIRISTNFLATVLQKTNLAGWNARTESIFRRRPTGVSDIRTEIGSNHAYNVKLTTIRATAQARTAAAQGRHADTIRFYQLIANIPANIGNYAQVGTAPLENNTITNAIKALTPRVAAFALA